VHHREEKTKDLPLQRKKTFVVFLVFKRNAGKDPKPIKAMEREVGSGSPTSHADGNASLL